MKIYITTTYHYQYLKICFSSHASRKIDTVNPETLNNRSAFNYFKNVDVIIVNF